MPRIKLTANKHKSFNQIGSVTCKAGLLSIKPFNLDIKIIPQYTATITKIAMINNLAPRVLLKGKKSVITREIKLAKLTKK